VARWDIVRQTVTDRKFKLDGIDGFLVSTNGQVWLYGAYEIWLFERGEWLQVDENRNLRGRPYEMVQIDDGTIWVATSSGYSTWNQDTALWELSQVTQPGLTLVQGEDNSLWFGLPNGILQLKSKELSHWTIEDGLINDKIIKLLIASDGTLWAGTYGGVNHWNGKMWMGWEELGYPDPDGLVVSELFETKDGEIWAGTSEGVARWDGQKWQTYPTTYSGTIYSFVESTTGDLWVGTGSGLFRLSDSGWTEYGRADGLQNSAISNLVQGTNGILYLSTQNGIYQYDPMRDRWVPFPN
jgi:ligand-binding sensor domain-containing protein